MVELTLADGTTITATDHHPIYNATTNTFTYAIDLNPTDLVRTRDGSLLEIIKTRTYADPEITAYNLSVADIHTYYAGTTPILVHNCNTDRGDGRDSAGRFTGSNGGGGYGASAEAAGLAEYAQITGNTVSSTRVRATLPGGGTRYYDGLAEDVDGSFIGVEVKSGSATLSSSQRAFDQEVNGGTAATATLNGRSISISSTYLQRTQRGSR